MFLLLFAAVCQGQEAGATLGMTNQHNFYRCLHGSPFIVWDPQLQLSAMSWAANRQADSCIPRASGTSHGESMLWSHGISRAGPAAVDAFYSNNPVNRNGQFNARIDDVYQTFYQVIWKASTRFGCAVVTCPALQDQLVVCHYEQKGSTGTDADARSNTSNVVRLVPECQTIADAHDVGMFVSPETDGTNPGGIAVGALIGAISTLVVAGLLFRYREGWKKWTSSKLANAQPVVIVLIQCSLQITTFALMVRALDVSVVWAMLPDGSTFNPKQICFMRTANGVPGASCVPYDVPTICSYQYTCNSVDALAAGVIFLILACVCAWINLFCEAVPVIPRLPAFVDPKLFVPAAVGTVALEFVFLWNTLWFVGGYAASYLNMNGFMMANEGFIELIVCIPLLMVMSLICSAQLTLNTK